MRISASVKRRPRPPPELRPTPRPANPSRCRSRQGSVSTAPFRAAAARRVEALDVHVACFDGRGLARTDVEDYAGARARRVELLRVCDLGAVEAPVAKVGLYGVGVLLERELGEAFAGFEQRDARAK